MIEANVLVLKGLIAIKRDPGLAPVIAWLSESLEDADKRNRRTVGEVLYRGQGEAQTLEEILEKIRTSESTLRKVEELNKIQPSTERIVPTGW